MRRARYARREPTIALINIVFLLLVFFLVVGTLAPPLDREVTLVATQDLPPEAPPDALVVHADGTLSYRGQDIPSIAAYIAAAPADMANRPRLVPDRDLPAADLIAIGRAFREAGAETVLLVTEQGLR